METVKKKRLNHFDSSGKAVMVDISCKEQTKRIAITHGYISMNEQAFCAVREGTVKKGDVLGIARVAGIMAVKKTAELIPLCHTLQVTSAGLDFTLHETDHTIEAVCTVLVTGRTGVEMEALTGVATALLTIYDMCKALDRSMCISRIELLKKDGGESGLYER